MYPPSPAVLDGGGCYFPVAPLCSGVHCNRSSDSTHSAFPAAVEDTSSAPSACGHQQGRHEHQTLHSVESHKITLHARVSICLQKTGQQKETPNNLRKPADTFPHLPCQNFVPSCSRAEPSSAKIPRPCCNRGPRSDDFLYVTSSSSRRWHNARQPMLLSDVPLTTTTLKLIHY
jgi:hypothetical protein